MLEICNAAAYVYMYMLTIVASFVQPSLCDVVLQHVLHLVDALDEPG